MNYLDHIRDFLRRKDFYAFLVNSKDIFDNYQREYIEISGPLNKRNLYFNQNWENIASFGKARRVVTIDLGGTNLNLFDINVTADNEIEVTNTYSDSFYEDKVYTPEILYTDITKALNQLVLDSVSRESLTNIVFIFSYPLEQVTREDGLIDAVCTKFIKEHKSEGLVGAQVGKGLEDYLHQHGYPKVKISVTNDTPIHVFSAKSYEIVHGKKFDASMNIIAGTGCNVATAFNEASSEHQGLKVINTEFGNFTGAPLSEFDLRFEEKTINKGVQLNEKMISGAYQSEIFKIIVSELVEENLIDRAILDQFNLDGKDSKDIEKALDSTEFSSEEYQPLHFIWREINKRGGALCGVFLAIIMKNLLEVLSSQKQIEKLNLIIMQTGSVVGKNKGFRGSMIDTLDTHLGFTGISDKITYEIHELNHQAAYGSVIFDSFSNPA